MKLLVTGAAGKIGRMLRPRLAVPGRTLRLADRTRPPAGADGAEVVALDVADPAAVATACAGVDAVVHLAAIAGEASFSDVVRVNVHGSANVLASAQRAGVATVVIASSIHAVGFYSRDDAGPDGLADEVAPRPDSYYGWSKAATESLASLYADKFGMSITALRIGTCEVEPPHTRSLTSWLSPDDASRLVEAALVAGPGFRPVWGVSANTRRWWARGGGDAIGYRPQDDAEEYAEKVRESPVFDTVGGPFCLNPLGGSMN